MDPALATPSSALPPAPVSAVADAIHDGLQFAMASKATLANEPAAYLSGLAQDIVTASSQLAASRNLFDVLAAQQWYIMARSKAWADSASRCFERCVTDPGSPQQEPGHLVVTE